MIYVSYFGRSVAAGRWAKRREACKSARGVKCTVYIEYISVVPETAKHAKCVRGSHLPSWHAGSAGRGAETHEKRPQRPCCNREHGSERPRSMGRCRVELSMHAAATLASLARWESRADDRRKRVFGCEGTLSPAIRQRLLPRQRGETRWGVRG